MRKPESLPAISLLNTRRGGKRGAEDATDSLHSFTDLASWAVDAGVVTAADITAKAEPEKVRAASFVSSLKLRSALERFLTQRNTAARRAFVKCVNAALEQGDGVTALRLDGDAMEIVQGYRTRTAANLPLAIAMSMLDFVQSVPLERVKRCEAENCIWFFVDTTKNGSRRWCTSEMCGARFRARRYYHKSRELRSP
jgi:predicted RNA-binding Zn ribbon-like protein